MRKLKFVSGELYHLYNRGTDKRPIFMDVKDRDRFFESMWLLNAADPIGSIYEYSFLKPEKKARTKPLVHFIAYCLNPNHYHFLVKQLRQNGIEHLLHRLGTGYTLYFNNRYKRTGSLFQGKFKASHINSNEYLLHVSAYINLNYKTHQLGGRASKLVRSSWPEYTISEVGGGNYPKICHTRIIFEQFRSAREYEEFALLTLEDILARKKIDEEFQHMLID